MREQAEAELAAGPIARRATSLRGFIETLRKTIQDLEQAQDEGDAAAHARVNPGPVGARKVGDTTARFTAIVQYDPKYANQLRDGTLRTLNALRGFPQGFPLSMRQADCEAADPGGLAAQNQAMRTTWWEAEFAITADGRVDLIGTTDAWRSVATDPPPFDVPVLAVWFSLEGGTVVTRKKYDEHTYWTSDGELLDGEDPTLWMFIPSLPRRA